MNRLSSHAVRPTRTSDFDGFRLPSTVREALPVHDSISTWYKGSSQRGSLASMKHDDRASQTLAIPADFFLHPRT